jgi:hypothetical protein
MMPQTFANSANAFSMAKFVAIFNGATNEGQHCSAEDIDSANAPAHLADSWRCPLLALPAIVFSRAATSWQRCLMALSTKTFACTVAAC